MSEPTSVCDAHNGEDEICSGNSEFEIIGYSEEKRPLVVTNLGKPSSKFRIFVIAGQHGNEKYGCEAVRQLTSAHGNNFNISFPDMRMAILTNANPDGSLRNTRRNALGIDLNRDHQRLDSKETYSIHSFIRRFRPHLAIDVHNYRTRRKHLLEREIVYYHDIFIDFPTNPAIIQPLVEDKLSDLLRNVQLSLDSHNISCERYTMAKRSGKVRHSTADVRDARNSIALRYNLPTVLIEGRKPTKREGRDGEKRAISAQYKALFSILEWAGKYKGYFTVADQKPVMPSVGDKVAVRSRYAHAKTPLKMTFKNAITNEASTFFLPNYFPSMKATKYAQLPRGYAVPTDKPKVIGILMKHEFLSYPSEPSKLEQVEYHVIQSTKVSTIRNMGISKISTAVHSELRNLENYLIFPTSQEGGHSLAVFLEPNSKYGLHRYQDTNLSMQTGSQYPIIRLM